MAFGPATLTLSRMQFQKTHFIAAILLLFFFSTLLLSIWPLDPEYVPSIVPSTSGTATGLLKHLYSSSFENAPSRVTSNVHLIPHLHAEGFIVSSQLCPIHNLSPRPVSERGRLLKVIDVVIVDSPGNVEDLLELRMEETKLSVDKYFIVEFGTTRDGRRKREQLLEPKKKDRFKNYWKKIEYRFMPAEVTDEMEPEEMLDLRQRTVDKLITSHIHELKPELKIMVLTSTIEQIISRPTVQLLRNCVFPYTGMKKGWLEYTKRYLYSFEFPLPALPHPNSYVRMYQGGGAVLNPKPGDFGGATDLTKDQWLLPNVGWECVHCYRKVDNYVLKEALPLHGHNHGREGAYEPSLIGSDKLGKGKDGEEEKKDESKTKGGEGWNWRWNSHKPSTGAAEGLSKEEVVQEKLCKGEWIEELGVEPKNRGEITKLASTGHTLRALLDKWQQYRYLLPGGCVREDTTERKQAQKDTAEKES